MVLFTIVFGFVALVLIGIGFAIGLVGCVLTGLLVSFGVISSSVAIGVRSGRPAAGLRAFVLQCGIVIGVPAGIVCAWLAHSFFTAYGSGWPVLLYGALAGAVAGVLVAFSLSYVVRRVHGFAVSRLPNRSQPTTPPAQIERAP